MLHTLLPRFERACHVWRAEPALAFDNAAGQAVGMLDTSLGVARSAAVSVTTGSPFAPRSHAALSNCVVRQPDQYSRLDKPKRLPS